MIGTHGLSSHGASGFLREDRAGSRLIRIVYPSKDLKTRGEGKSAELGNVRTPRARL